MSSKKASAAATASTSRNARTGGDTYPDDSSHPHVLVAAQSHDGAQHRQPEEQSRCELIRPENGLMEDVAGYDAREQDDDFGHHQEGSDILDRRAGGAFDRHQPLPPTSRPARRNGSHLY